MNHAAHHLVLLSGMSRVLEAIMRDIEAARRRVWIESYIVRDDRLGNKLAGALTAAHDRGVDVRLLYDALGSKNTPPEFIEEIRAAGVDARAYRPLRPVLLSVFPRDHARIVLIDEVGYTGGSAWGDEWLPVAEGGKGWHDVCVRISGPCVGDFEHIFRERWARHRSGDVMPARSVIARHRDLTVVSDLADGADSILGAHVAAVRRSERRIWIENSYFFPPPAFLKDLALAARRGVDVRILLPGESDLPSCSRAARGEYAKWIGSGLKLAEYRKTVMHSKIAVIDDDWCTVGTCNINSASFACAHELNVIVHDRAFVARVAEQISRDFHDSEPVTIDDVRRWPAPLWFGRMLTARTFRILEWLFERRRPRLLWNSDAPADGNAQSPL